MSWWLENWIKSKSTELLDTSPTFLREYLERNPDRLEKIVTSTIDEVTLSKWLKNIDSPKPTAHLLPLKIDYLKDINSKAHHTNDYDNSNLVIRRAAKFDVVVFFKNRSFNQSSDKLVLKFGIGENPTVSNKTLFRVPVGSDLDESKWSSKMIKADDSNKSLKVQINIPADAIIGKYQVNVETNTWVNNEIKVESKAVENVIVLFNPFSKADEVYMEEEDRRAEYVLNSEGIIYYGSYMDIGGMHWLFGQFEPGILDIALKLLREAPNVQKNPVKCTKKRSSAIYCSRTLSAMVNCNDDNGVLYGRWDGKYEDGKKPTSWNGSVKILREWNSNGMAKVKYGQCWVFSGILTTVLRAIGIPARSVTNFKSAHDTEFNMTIDRFIDSDGEESETMNSGDSIWNFHVWNEGWFRRPDLPKGYDGWQAVDATPQEESNGVYQCGPAPVKAVKNGEIYLGYDTNFLFSEVNADRLTWKLNKNGEVDKLVRRERSLVGKSISTKAVGENKRNNITLDYKYPEGSPQEKEAFERAYAFGMKAPYHKFDFLDKEGDITINIEKVGEAVNGKPIHVTVKVKNNTKEKKDAILTTVMSTVLHTGLQKTLILKKKLEATLAVGKENVQNFEIPFSDYGRHLVDDNIIQVFSTVHVQKMDDSDFFVDSYDLRVKSPDCLTIECPDTMKSMQYVDVSFTFVNPFPVTLTAGVFSIEANGVVADEKVKISEPIPPNATIKTPSLEIQPYRLGDITLVADFDCNEISNIKGTKKVTVSFGM